MEAPDIELRGTAVDEEGKGGSGCESGSGSGSGFRIGMMMLCSIQVCGLGAVHIAAKTAATRSFWPVEVNVGLVLLVAILRIG